MVIMKKGLVGVGILIICFGLVWFINSNDNQTNAVENNQTSNLANKTNLINHDNESESASKIVSQALILMSDNNAFTYMQYFHNQDFVGTEFYKDNHSIIFNTTDNIISYQEYENNDRLNDVNFIMEFTPSDFGFKVTDHDKVITDNQTIFELIENKLQENNNQFSQFIILYLMFGATNDIDIESREKVIEYVPKKMLGDSTKASVGMEPWVMVGDDIYGLTMNGNVLIGDENYSKYFTNKQNEQENEFLTQECEGNDLCNNQTALKFLSYHLGYEDDSNAGFMINEQNNENINVTVFAKDLPGNVESAEFTVDLNNQTYNYAYYADTLKLGGPIDKNPDKVEKISEYNSTIDNQESEKICKDAVNTLQKGENFYGSKAVPSGIGFAAFLNTNNDVIIKTTILSVKENGGSGTAGIYTVKADGTYTLDEGFGEDVQCAFGKF